MSGCFPAQPQVAGRGHESTAEMMRPRPVHDHPRRQWVAGGHQRTGQIEAAARSSAHLRTPQQHRHPPLHYVAAPRWTAAQENRTVLRLRAIDEHHRPRWAPGCFGLMLRDVELPSTKLRLLRHVGNAHRPAVRVLPARRPSRRWRRQARRPSPARSASRPDRMPRRVRQASLGGPRRVRRGSRYSGWRRTGRRLQRQAAARVATAPRHRILTPRPPMARGLGAARSARRRDG